MTELLAAATHADHSDDQDVRGDIRDLFASRSLQAGRYGPLYASLWKTGTQRVLGGKLLRPRLLLGAFDALSSGEEQGGASRRSAVRIAAATEVLHYSFLLHDDVIDGDVLRRGRTNLIGAILDERRAQRSTAHASSEVSADERDLHWARTSGILMGNMLLSDAHQVFAREALPEQMRMRLLDLLDHAITESIVGEHLDVALSDGVSSPDMPTVLAMTRLKTATYTFELPLQAASVLAGSTRAVEDALGEIGKRLGSAFQLQDDLLSVFGDAAEHGKDAHSDLREGKETAIIAFARTRENWREIEPLFGDPGLGTSDALTIRRLLRESGAEGFVRSLVAEHLDAARELIAAGEPALPAELSRFLGGILHKIEERRS